jgi:alkanesulfonate monooxygenase SsuD/methylene tetrahydromethanopterin reductase-like flavin-dependent oxidoreductase (luciferase family)
MKFYSFDELTYPAVPAEVGPEVRFTNRFCDPRAVAKTYREHLDEWVLGEELGFDGAFVNEHHFTAINTQPSCNITATAIIMRTERMRVGVIGNILPLRHPVQTAEEFAMMDCLSGGRFIAGIVRGVPFEYVSYNIDPFTSSERLAESYDIVHKCLTEELFDYDGKYWKLTGVSIWPKPIQRPLPFWMPTGSLETIEFAAERRIVGCQVFYPSEAFRDSFDLYRKVARERFDWEPGHDQFVGARLIHVAETNAQAIAEAREATGYFFRVFSRPVNNPAPVPGLHSDRSFTHRKRIERDFPGPHTPFEQMREDGFIVCGDPDYVASWLENDMRIAGYGHFLGMFHVGNLPHEKVMASKRLFAAHVMPRLRGLNLSPQSGRRDETARAEAYEVKGKAGGKLPLYQDFNYMINRDAPEVIGQFARGEEGRTVSGWEMRVPEREPNGFPYQIIFSGPTSEHRGSAIRLRLSDTNGNEIAPGAQVLIEAHAPAESDRQAIFSGKYREFAEISDQHAPNAAVAAQRRVVAEDGYIIRLTVITAEGGAHPDPAGDGSFFELECFKHLLNVTA